MHTKRRFHSVLRAMLLAAASSVLLSPCAIAADADVLVSMPEPPDDYVVMAQPMVADGKQLGRTVVVVKEGSSARVVITVETSFDRSTRPARVAATKGYVNGTASTLKNMGMERVDTKLPDLEKADFTTPLQVDMTFAQADGSKLYMRQFIFFTKHGYHVQIGASNLQDLETIAKWAQHIKPAE